MSWNLQQSWDEGLPIQIGKRLTSGPLLKLADFQAAVSGLSNLPKLAEYAEVEIAGVNGAESTYILTASLIDSPQFILGYQESGHPILLGINRAIEGNMSIMGASRSGKTTALGTIIRQVAGLGFATVIIGQKNFDRTLFSSAKAGAEAETRLDVNGDKIKAPFRFATLQPGLRTSGFNFFAQDTFNGLPEWLLAANTLQALGLSGNMNDPSHRYYNAAAQQWLQSVPWGASARELLQNAQSKRLDKDMLYATAGARFQLEQQAVIEANNLSKDDPAAVNLEWLIRERGVLYFEGCSLEVADVATSAAGLLAQAVLSAKRKIDPTSNTLLFLFIDEAQLFPQAFLRRLVEQCSSLGCRLVIAYHSLEQLGEQKETISMTQCRLFCSAVPGSASDRHLQALFGTKKSVALTLGISNSDGISGELAGDGSGAHVKLMTGWSSQKGSNVSISEKEEMAWSGNDTLALNYDKRRFVLQVSPGAEFACFGPQPVRGTSGGPPMPWDEINRIAKEGLAEESTHTFLPGTPRQKLASSNTYSREQEVLRSKFERAALRLRKAIHGA